MVQESLANPKWSAHPEILRRARFRSFLGVGPFFIDLIRNAWENAV